RRILDYRRMRIGSYHLRNAKIGLRCLSERSRCLLLTTTAATAAGLLLFRLAAPAVSLIQSGSAFVRRWLRIRNVGNHLGEFPLLGIFRCGKCRFMPVPPEQPTDNQEEHRKSRDNSGAYVARGGTASTHHCGAAITTK